MPVHEPNIERRYHACRFGELHVRRLPARDAATHPPLLCLHPSPHSGAYFATVMPLLNRARDVIAPDYPGYGGSSPPPAPPSIDDYAVAMLELLDDMEVARVDALGFHTGCLVAAETALQGPARIERLVLVDIPYFTGSERDELYARTAVPRPLNADPSCLASEWETNVTQRLDAMSLARAIELFVESLRAADRSHWGFHAAFTYPSDERLPSVMTPTHVIATQSGLLDATRRAARALPDVRLIERLDIVRAVFEEGASRIAAEIEAALE